MISFELKEKEENGSIRMIVYVNEKEFSYGVKCKKSELYELYSQLRELFDNDN